ncbi:glycosyltransferase family 9 protein [Halothermothrix orenii]|uniref:Glycosyl transferase family 9 n=1 Tax=Halothermothrix orenii (strain H 168 / OCM 544 / DSM 9562) TaxID=373903 RepID=B8CYV0_HALOH|nr:glycosyltransferase family 9 protein [Halothermothrix orenii]ACL70469.1 glycosyl transferase family 9 [Halothermothrix orenii H 168]
MKILVLILSALGDALFTTPALRALRNGYPDARIDALVWEDNKTILEGNPNLDRLIVSKGKGKLISDVQSLREEVYDLAIGLSNAGSYIAYLVNARKRLGFKGSEIGWMYDFNVPDDRNIHAVDYCLEIVKVAGGKPDINPHLEVAINDEQRRSVAEFMKKKGIITSLPLVAIHPGGKYFSLKRWPVDKFSELVKVLDKMIPLQVVLVGGPDDRELATRIIDPDYNYNRKPVIVAGELSVKETTALLEQVDLFIGNDSAPQHMASAVGVPVVSLFGPTNPANFYPYGTEHIIIRSDLSCSPCFSWLGDLKQYLPEYLPEWVTKCKGKCMEEIEVADVVRAARQLLVNKRSGYKLISTGGSV